MGKLKYLMIHCTATVQGAEIGPETIERMHKGAKDLPDGRVRFLEKNYENRTELPDVLIGGVKAAKTHGRGWSRVGYSKLFTEDGIIHDLVEYDEDNWINYNEVTYGASGFNSVTRHFVYAGGLAKRWEIVGGRRNHPFENTMSSAQEFNLINAVKREIKLHPDIKIIGHNQVAVKGCPCFDVREWAKVAGIPENNVDQRKLLVHLRKPL